MSPSETWRRLRRARGGAVVVETALMLPLIAIGVAALVDVSLYLQLTARAERTAAGLADLAARADEIRDRPLFDAASRSGDTGALFEMARAMAEPADLSLGGAVLASVTGSGTGATLNWARADGAAAAISPDRITATGPLPAGMPFIVAEVFMPFDPIILDRADLLGAIGFDRLIYRRAVWRPRGAALTRLEPAP